MWFRSSGSIQSAFHWSPRLACLERVPAGVFFSRWCCPWGKRTLAAAGSSENQILNTPTAFSIQEISAKCQFTFGTGWRWRFIFLPVWSRLQTWDSRWCSRHYFLGCTPAWNWSNPTLKLWKIWFCGERLLKTEKFYDSNRRTFGSSWGSFSKPTLLQSPVAAPSSWTEEWDQNLSWCPRVAHATAGWCSCLAGGSCSLWVRRFF